MKMQIPEWVTPGLWGAAAGAAAIAIVGFGTGLVITSSNARDMAERQAEKAVISSLTPICVAQFKKEKEPERTALLASLQKEDYWERPEFVEKHGWATMPGASEPTDEIAATCAEELLKVGQT